MLSLRFIRRLHSKTPTNLKGKKKSSQIWLERQIQGKHIFLVSEELTFMIQCFFFRSIYRESQNDELQMSQLFQIVTD